MNKLIFFGSVAFLYYCVLINGEQLLPEDVPDLIGNKTCQKTHSSANASSIFSQIDGKVMTIYFASQAAIRRIAYAALNRPADSLEELNRTCSTLMFFKSSFMQKGFQNGSWVQPFLTKGQTRIEIAQVTVENYPTTNAQEYELPVTSESIVWTDGEKHALFVRCVKDQQEWKMVTIGGPPEEWAKQIALEKVKEMGMDPALAFETTDCPPLEDPVDYAQNGLQNILSLTKNETNLLKPIFGYLNTQNTTAA